MTAVRRNARAGTRVRFIREVDFGAFRVLTHARGTLERSAADSGRFVDVVLDRPRLEGAEALRVSADRTRDLVDE